MGLTHLQRLEAESIHIMREVVAETERPVMLYSIGKDSAVMLHLAKKAFYPAPPPFPLLHVDTTWKFQEMYELRDEWPRARRGWSCSSIAIPRRRRAGSTRSTTAPLHTDMWKTEGLKQALDQYGFDAAFGGARRDEEKSRAKERIFSLPLRRASLGPEEPAARAVEPLQRAQGQGREHPRLPAVATGPSSTSGSTSCRGDRDRPALPRRAAADGGARRPAPDGRRRALSAASRAKCRSSARSASARSAATR